MGFVGIDERNVPLAKVVRMLLDQCHQELRDGRAALAPYVGLVERTLARDGGVYDGRSVPLEGTLQLERIAPMLPMMCVNQVACTSPYSPHLVGVALTETGASNLANVERLLEILNGREVRVTVEWKGDKPNVEANGKDGAVAAPPGEGVPGVGREVPAPRGADAGDAGAGCRG